ncbi:hypothetical protein [Pseudomonas sp. MWU15-20650]|uniref:hypothetical protein n=1 Tax=Pseudomonas sp. MWU15-20650 TaxID=2933107 RepID=UPI002010990F|nr:hypothetical protein [Pseudomonas sp. MWU15-20650]
MAELSLRQLCDFQARPYAEMDVGKSAPSYPRNVYADVPNSQVARAFSKDFDVFRDSRTDFVSRGSIENMAGRPFTGNRDYDRKIMLAETILKRPEMEHLLDAITQNGHEDGLISHGDVSKVIDYYEAQEASSNQPPRGQDYPGRYNGAMQQQRVNQQYVPQYSGPSPVFERACIPQQPNYGSPTQLSGNTPYANMSKSDFCNQLLSHFGALEDPSRPGTVTDKSLIAIASGHSLDGQPVSQETRDIAQELLNRGGLFKELDQGRTGELNGAFTRQDVGDTSDGYKDMSDHTLLQGIKNNFRQFTTGPNDRFINRKELEEAAGKIPSNRVFNPEATKLATELFNRPGLLQELDIGIGDNGPGAEDGRFDRENIDYMLAKKRTAPKSEVFANVSAGRMSASAGW